MKAVAVLVLVALAVVAQADEDYAPYDLTKAPELFAKFQKDFNRDYKNPVDRNVHFEAFKRNLAEMNEQARHMATGHLGINKFADYTEDEKRHLAGHGGN